MKKLSQKEFLEKAKAVHGDKYDYCKEDLNSIVNELEKYIKNYNRQQ